MSVKYGGGIVRARRDVFSYEYEPQIPSCIYILTARKRLMPATAAAVAVVIAADVANCCS